MAIVVIIIVLLGLFVVALMNQDPCTTAITTCAYNALKGNGVVDVQSVEQLVLVVLVVGALYQLHRSRINN